MSLLLTAAIGFSLWQWMDSRAQNDVNCSPPYYVNETLPNGTRWELCWEHRSRDGIVLRDIYYTPPERVRSRVLTEASIAQVHVPYDDNSARFHDITDDGFGDSNIADLTAAECPGGTLLAHEQKNVLCQQIMPIGYARRAANNSQQRFALTLFSVSTSGEYNYIPLWRFEDNGSIEPMMGATGKLQRFDTGGPHSWPVRDTGIAGISHIHNYYWRLDFDLGENAVDDVVEEIDVVPAQSGNGRVSSKTILESEAARSISPEIHRTWQIRNLSHAGLVETTLAYQLDPFALNHRDVGPDFEPWTHHDLFITNENECERYTSHNPQFGGCGSNVTDFVDGESLVNADLVLWYGVTFHHIPRDEDEPFMHTHWDGFQLKAVAQNHTDEPVPETTFTPLPTPTITSTPIVTPTTIPITNSPPIANLVLSPITGTIPLTVTLDASQSSDPDGEIASYKWRVGDRDLTANAITVTHLFTVAGSYPITLTVADEGGLTAQSSRTITALAKSIAECGIGDVNCDGKSSIADAILILELSHGRRFVFDNGGPPSTVTLLGPPCDVDSDGDCDRVDAVTIFECSTEIANPFCPVPMPTSATAAEVARFEELLLRLNNLYLPVLRQ